MFSTSGFFRGLNCPQYAHGGPGRTCRRPYCHFRHVRKDADEQAKSTSSVSSTDKKATTSKSDYVSTSLPNWKKKKNKLKVGEIQRNSASATYIPTPPLAQKKQAPGASDTFGNPFGQSEDNHDEYDPTNAALGNQVSSSGKYSLDAPDGSNQAGKYVPTSSNSCSHNASVDKYSYQPTTVHGVSEYDPLETNEALNSAQKYSISTGPATDLEYDPLENSSLDSIQGSEAADSYDGGAAQEEYDPTESTQTSKYSVDESDTSDINTLYSVEAYDPLESVTPKDGNLYTYSTSEYSYSTNTAAEVQYHPTISPCKRKASSDITQEKAKKMKPATNVAEAEDDLHNWEMDAWFSEDEDETTNWTHKKRQRKSRDISSDEEDPLVIDLQNDNVSDPISGNKKSIKNDAEVKIGKEKKELKTKQKSVKSNDDSKKTGISDIEFTDDDELQGATNKDEQTGTSESHNVEHNDVEVLKANVCENKEATISKESKEPVQVAKLKVSSEQLADFFSKRLQQPAKNKLKNRKRTSSENIFVSKSKDKFESVNSSKSKGTSAEDQNNIFNLMTESTAKKGGKSISSDATDKKSSQPSSVKNAEERGDKDNEKKFSKHIQKKNSGSHKSKDGKVSNSSTGHQSSSSKDKHSDKKTVHKSSSMKDTGSSKQKVSEKEKHSSKSADSVCDKEKSSDKKVTEKSSSKHSRELKSSSSKESSKEKVSEKENHLSKSVDSVCDKVKSSDKKVTEKSSSKNNKELKSFSKESSKPVSEEEKHPSKSADSACDKVKSSDKVSEKASTKNSNELNKSSDRSKSGDLKSKTSSGKQAQETSQTSSSSKHISGDKTPSKSSSNKHKTVKPNSDGKGNSSSTSEVKKSKNSSSASSEVKKSKSSSSASSEVKKSKNSSSASNVKESNHLSSSSDVKKSKNSSKGAIKTFDMFGSLSESSSDDLRSSSKKLPSMPKTSTARKDSSKKAQRDVYELSTTTSDDSEFAQSRSLAVRKKKHANKMPKEIKRSQSVQNDSGVKVIDVFDLTSDSSELDVWPPPVNGSKTHHKVYRSQSWAPQSATREAGSTSSKRKISEEDLFGEDSSGEEEVDGDENEVIFVKETSLDDIKPEVINLLSSDESDDDEGVKKVMKASSKELSSSNGAIKDKVKLEKKTHSHKHKHQSSNKDSSSVKRITSSKHKESDKSNRPSTSDSVKRKHLISDTSKPTGAKNDKTNHHHSKNESSKHKHSKSNESNKHSKDKSVLSKVKDALHSVQKKHGNKEKEADKLKKGNRPSIHKGKTSVSDKSKLKSSSKETCKKDKSSAISKSTKKKSVTQVVCLTPNEDGSDAENYALSEDESMDVDIPEDFHMDDTDISFSEMDTYDECLKIFNEETATLNDTMKKQVPPSFDEFEESSSPVVVGKKRVAHAPKHDTSYIKKNPYRAPRRAQPSPAQVCQQRLLLAQKQALQDVEHKVSPPPERSPDKTYPKVSTDKKRVAHIPNFAAPSNDAFNAPSSTSNKRVSRVPSSSSSSSGSSPSPRSRATPYVSSRRQIMEKKFAAVHRANSGWEIPGKTLATTADKGGRRLAHVPTKVSPRPVIPASHGGKVPSVVRQRYLNLFIDEFLKTSDTEKDAFDLGLKEEKAIFERASNKPIYLNLSINNLKRLRTERADPNKATPSSPPPKNAVSHSAVLGGKAAAQGAFTLHRSAGKPVAQGQYHGKELYEKLKPYLLTKEQLWDNGYPRSAVIPGQAEVKEPEKASAAADPNQKVCCRCGKTFLRRPDGQYITKETCSFHWGKLWRQKVGGMIEHRFSCCSGDSESHGCGLSKLHVTEEKTSNLSGFMKTYSKSPGRDKSYPGLYALDCEMCYTVKGMELTRVTVVDDQFKQVYDSLVKPDNDVVDYNTRFSGITEDDLKSVDTKLHNVQAVLLNMFSSETILIGHSLESDMLSLKLIHETVIDTSVVFPHKMGPPYKRALKNLMAEKVKKIIQSDVGGHDSMEDAKSCLELMVWKVKEDAKTKR